MATEISLNPTLLRFWDEHAQPGRIGLIHLDFAPAKLINWGQKWVTRDGKPSPWVHTFLFLDRRDGIPWIAESDVRIPLPGFRTGKPDGPQMNPVSKWSIPSVDRAAVLELPLSREQINRMHERAVELVGGKFTYPYLGLFDTWMGYIMHNPGYRGLFYSQKEMHCSHFVRECLAAAQVDPFGPHRLSQNVSPEHLSQAFPIVASWSLREAPAPQPIAAATHS